MVVSVPVIVTMLISMPVIMNMVVLMVILIFILMMVRLVRICFAFSDYRYFGAGNAVTLVTGYLQTPTSGIEFVQTADQSLTADSQVKHGSQVHVTADSGKTVVVQYLHSDFSFFNTSSAGRTVAHARILRLLI
jgi:hypothetical protein